MVAQRRAFGGPLASALLGALARIPPAMLPVGGGLWRLALFFLLDNLLPLGFTGGSTLLRWAARDSRAPIRRRPRGFVFGGASGTIAGLRRRMAPRA